MSQLKSATFYGHVSLLLTLQEPKQPPALQFGHVSCPYLMFDLLIAQDAPNRVPQDGEHANYGSEHASSHREYPLCMPAIILQGWPRRQA